MKAAALQDGTKTRRLSFQSTIGLVLIALLIAIGVFAPLIASRLPIVCRYDGALYWPATMETLSRLPLVGRCFSVSAPFSRADFDARKELDPAAFAMWPLIRYSPLEIGETAMAPSSADHWLGTDDRGRDVAARLVHGAAVSVRVAVLSMLIAGVIGVLVGGAAGYAGGWIDVVLSRLIEVAICFPAFFLILSVMVWFEPNMTAVIVVIGLTQWTGPARYVRAEFLRMREADFVLAARCTGATGARIVFRHMLPGAVAPLLVALTFGLADAVLIEAGLSWLGFGVPTPNPSWGNMLRAAFDQFRSAPMLVYPPCAAIVLSVMVFHLAGDGLRKSLDPRTALSWR